MSLNPHDFNLTAQPVETIEHVLRFLEVPDIKRLGRTYNRFLTPICIASLHSAQAISIDNARKMIGLFDLTEHYDRWSGEDHIWRKACGTGFTDYDFRGSLREAYEKAGLAQKYGPFRQRSTSPERQHLNLSYLDLCGDLRWLLRRGPGISASEISSSIAVNEPDQTWMTNIRELRTRVGELELKLPLSHDTLFTNLSLMEMIPSSTSCFWTVGPLIHVVHPTRHWIDLSGYSHSIDGYITEVYSDQQGCYHWYLYMDNTGGHCVLGSPKRFPDEGEEPLSEVTSNREMPILDLSSLELDYQLHLHATEFEEFLVKTYFSELAWYWAHKFTIHTRPDIKKDEIPAELEEYLVRIFTGTGP